MRRLIVAAVVLSLGVATQATAAISAGIGAGGGCQQVAREIARNWFDLRDFMGGEAGERRPRAGDFQCVSPYYAREAMPRTVPGVRGSLQCFRLQGSNFCCDNQLRECASL